MKTITRGTDGPACDRISHCACGAPVLLTPITWKDSNPVEWRVDYQPSAKGYILIRNNQLVATGPLETLKTIASNGADHATIYNLDSMELVAEYNAFKPLGAPCEECGATLTY